MQEAKDKSSVTAEEIRSLDGALLRGNTKFTSSVQEVFLKHLAETGNVSLSAKRAGVGTTTIYEERLASDGFKRLFEQARGIYADKVEAELHSRIFNGVKKPVFFQGVEVGHVTEFSDRLIEFHLKALKPEKYRERYEVTGKDGDALVLQLVKFGDLPTQDEIAETSLTGEGGDDR